MQQTKSRNGNGRKNRGKTPDLMATLGKKRGPGRPPKPAPTADQIADSLEKHIKGLQHTVNILRGKV